MKIKIKTSLWLLLLLLSPTSVVSDSVRPHRRQPTRILQARTLEWVDISFSILMAKTILKNKEKLEKIFAKHITDQALIFVFIKVQSNKKSTRHC